MHRLRWDDWSLIGFYTLTAAVGILGLLDPSLSPSATHFIKHESINWLLSAQLIAFGSIGVVSRIFGVRNAEFWSILGVALVYSFHGGVSLDTGQGLRLLSGPFLMVPYAVLRRCHADDWLWCMREAHKVRVREYEDES